MIVADADASMRPIMASLGPGRTQRRLIWVRPQLTTVAPHPSTRPRGTDALTADVLGQAELMRRRCRVPPSRSSLAGFHFPREVIVLAVRWYLRYGLSYRDVEELLSGASRLTTSLCIAGCSGSRRC